jgi:hypothetical protein
MCCTGYGGCVVVIDKLRSHSAQSTCYQSQSVAAVLQGQLTWAINASAAVTVVCHTRQCACNDTLL